MMGTLTSTVVNADSIKTSISNSTLQTKTIQGRFLKIEKNNDRDYDLYLKLHNHSIMVFNTLIIISENEIPFLKKNGDNISLSYSEYNNPVTKRVDNMVKRMTPIYDLK